MVEETVAVVGDQMVIEPNQTSKEIFAVVPRLGGRLRSEPTVSRPGNVSE